MASSYGEDASKQALRSAYLELPTLSPSHQARLDGDILSHLRSLFEYRTSDLILAFLSQREEADTRVAIERALADGKRVALPVYANDGTVEFRVVSDLDHLSKGAGGGLEPSLKHSEPVDEDELPLSMCLVPGLIFDAEGYRVAYGAGYVDNFLSDYPGCKVSLARTVQISSNPLPRDDHDVAVDVLVSDGAIWRCRR